MPGSSFLLVADLEDVSILSSGFEDIWKSLADHADIALAYLTECHLFQSLDRLRTAGLPEPAFLGCDQGTTLYVRKDETYILDAQYRNEMGRSLGAVDASTLRHMMAETFPQLRPQEFDQQGEFKLSYYIDSWKDFQEMIAAIKLVLNHVDARVQLALSVEPGDGRGRLRLLPEQVSKVSPLGRFGELTGLPSERIVYAASGSTFDLTAIAKGHRCILVPGGKEVDEVELARSASQTGTHVCFGREYGAAAILEGCRALGLVAEP